MNLVQDPIGFEKTTDFVLNSDINILEGPPEGPSGLQLADSTTMFELEDFDFIEPRQSPTNVETFGRSRNPALNENVGKTNWELKVFAGASH